MVNSTAILYAMRIAELEEALREIKACCEHRRDGEYDVRKDILNIIESVSEEHIEDTNFPDSRTP